MPLTPERQRHLMRLHPKRGNLVKEPELRRCGNVAAWWLARFTILPDATRFHYQHRDGCWYGQPYVDTTATEEAIDRSFDRRTLRRMSGT
jgi:hypothetical protein